jgi:hypothetical protein
VMSSPITSPLNGLHKKGFNVLVLSHLEQVSLHKDDSQIDQGLLNGFHKNGHPLVAIYTMKSPTHTYLG